jgi:small ligand-binding sensory domain FIST
LEFASALSQHPIPVVATGEVIGQVVDALGTGPDAALIFATPGHAGALEDIAAAVRTIVAPAALAGCVAHRVLAGSAAAGPDAGLCLWAAKGVDVRPLPQADDIARPAGAILMARDAAGLAGFARSPLSATPVAGALCGGGPLVLGGNSIDQRLLVRGAVGLGFGSVRGFSVHVAQGCRPIGPPLTVTRAEGDVVQELGGRPAFTRLLEIARDRVPASDIQLINAGLHLGVGLGPAGGQADFVMRAVLGTDPATGAIALEPQAAEPEPAAVVTGCIVRFHVADAGSAREELERRVAASGMGPAARSALVFSDHSRDAAADVATVSDALGGRPVAGIAGDAELGPAGGRTHRHTRAVVVALFGSMGRVTA